MASVIWRDHYWRVPLGTLIFLPNGQTTSLVAGDVLGTPRLTSQNQPAGSGCAASSSAQSYDAQGNATQRDDFNGNRTCYGYDLSRNLEAFRVEGLANTASCSGLAAASATLPAASRKVSTQWHPDWRLEAKRAEPGRIVTSVYNGQPDPIAGGTASCAPAGATLPDGKPIAVLCKRVEQASTDVDGSQGFSATLQSGVANRAWSYTYNLNGQVLTAKGPRTDVNETTTYTYYTDTIATHTLGDMATVTNPLGQVTQYTQYNKYGQLLQMVDPNGVITLNSYDLRQRLTSTNVAGQITSYSYDAAGQLIRVTLPDASYIGYEYDAAHRQRAVFDNLGNRIDYTLDNLGNRVAEAVKDAGGALRRQLTRSIDALGRVQQVNGRE